MSNAGLAIADRSSALQRREWEGQLDLVKKTVAPGLSDAEFQLFCHVARARNLDPLQRQIYAVKRATWNPETRQSEDRMVLQVGIDGFRSIANRTGLYMPSDRLPLTEGAGKVDFRVTVWVKKYHPMSGQWHEFGATALYREYVQTKKGPNGPEPNAMWGRMPVSQLTKCAEALALRRGWPEELGQIYADEEMQQADPVPEVQAPRKADRTQREMGTLRVSTEANRGHGQEGMKRAGEPAGRTAAETAAAEPVTCAECRGVNRHEPDCPHGGKTLRPDGSVDYGFTQTMPVEPSAPAEQAWEPAGEAEAGESSAEKKWRTAEGHDPKKHISFKQGRMLFAVQKSRQLSDGVMKALLLEEFGVEHRYLIAKEQFGKVLDTIDPNFAHHEKK